MTTSNVYVCGRVAGAVGLVLVLGCSSTPTNDSGDAGGTSNNGGTGGSAGSGGSGGSGGTAAVEGGSGTGGSGGTSNSDAGTETGASGAGGTSADHSFAQTLYAAGEGFLESYDIATGDAKPGLVTNVAGPTDMQTLADGTVIVHLTTLNQVLIVDGKTMLEKARVQSSGIGATRPVHSFITPTYGGKTYWVTMNDGTDATNTSAQFLDITPGSGNYLKRAGEVKLGIGHHKASFSSTQARAVMSNISDCDNVMSVYDFSDITNITTLATLTATAAGWTSADPGDAGFDPKFCDPTYARGLPPAPHGCGTSKISKHAYCNLTGSGDIVDVDIDATPPTFKVLHTHGNGSGYTKPSLDGHYLYSLQSSPREGDTNLPGATCQIGQLVVIDAMAGAIVKEVPILYTGPDCTTSIANTPQSSDDVNHIQYSEDGKTLYAPVEGGYQVADAREDQEVVFDLTDPANPVQKPSITHGLGTSFTGDALSGDGKFLFVTDNLAGSTSQIDLSTNTVTQAIKTSDPGMYNPLTLSTFGSAEGPSEHTGPIP